VLKPVLPAEVGGVGASYRVELLGSSGPLVELVAGDEPVLAGVPAVRGLPDWTGTGV
jgi:hypothetical protein